MSEAWAQRVKEVLEDADTADIAALLYLLVKASIDSPIKKKRRTPEEGLWEEAMFLMQMRVR